MRTRSGSLAGVLGGLYPLILSGLFVACGSKGLTVATAKKMLNDRLDSKGRQQEVLYASLTKMMSSRLQNYWVPGQNSTNDAAAMQRLLKAGYVVQDSADMGLPNLSGEWNGSTVKSGFGAACYQVSLGLQMKDSSSVNGTYRAVATCGFSYGGQGRLSGALSIGNQLSIHFNPVFGGLSDYDHAELTLSGPLEGPTKLDGVLLGASGMSRDPIILHGRVSSPPIPLKTYRYSFAQRFKDLVATEGNTIKAGPVDIDSLGGLLLEGTETAATARFWWHVDLNEAARALSGVTNWNGEGVVEFRKQPDGQWLLSEYRLR